jgi:hypothetical protein
MRLDPERLASGSKLYLLDEYGRKTDDWVVVLSRWADPVRFTLDDTEREGTKALATTGELSHELRGQLIRRVHASMILDWGGPTFGDGWPEEPTDENKIAWIKDNPNHADQIDTRSSSDRFFMMPSGGSSTGPEKKPD